MIELKQWNGSNVTPADDAALYSHFDGRSGVFVGCEITLSGSNELNISAGRGLIGGRQFVVEAETVMAELASSGTQSGRLLVRLDLTNTETPIAFVTQAAAVLPDLVQDDMSAGGTIYELVLATYQASTTAISELSTFDTLPPIFSSDGSLNVSKINTLALQSFMKRVLVQTKDGYTTDYTPVTQYPDQPGAYRTQAAMAGLPQGAATDGGLILFNCGTFCIHIFVNSSKKVYVGSSLHPNAYRIAAPQVWLQCQVSEIGIA